LPERFGRRQGYAFITFDNASDVEKALAEVNGKELLGREMRVQKATSGGPYASDSGEHGETTTGETTKARPKPRTYVCPSFTAPPLLAMRSRFLRQSLTL
jgi:RNA recognition motif-containing protein